MYQLKIKVKTKASGFDATRLLNATEKWYLSGLRNSLVLHSEKKREFRIRDRGALVCIFNCV